MKISRALAFVAVFAASMAAQAPAPAPTATRIMGAVTEIKAAGMTVKPDSGDPVPVAFLETTKFVRVAPGERDLTKAAPISQADILKGDRVLAVFSQKEPGAALRVVVMSQNEIAAKQDRERADWQKRGVSGVVSAVDKSAREIKIRIPAMSGEAQVVTVAMSDKTSLRRYAPDSIKFSDAKVAKVEEVKTGDQLRARGDKSEDGLRVTAEEVVTGAFKTVAATVVSASAETNEIQVKELNTNKPMTVVVSADSTVRRMPQMAMGFGGGAGGPGGGPGGGMRRPDMSQMMERMPKSTIGEIKAGETIIVASTQGASSDRLTAITLLANADGLIRMQQMMAARPGGGSTGGPQATGGGMGGWNLGEMSMPIQ